MKKGQIYQGVAGEIRFPNRAVVETAEGEQCLVDNVLPGQKVEFRVEKAKNGRFKGRLIRVIEKSEIETAKDVCPHFGVCGGCLYQSVPYIQQLRFKEYQVRSLLDKVQEDYKWEGIKSSPAQTAYRNKMEFSFGNEYKDGPLTLGLHRRGGFYDIVPVNECRIVDEDFRKILMITQMYFRAFSLSFYHKLTHEGVLRHLLVRKGLSTGEIMVGLVTTSGISEEILAGFTASLQSLSTNGTIESILQFTKSEAGASKTAASDIDVHALIEDEYNAVAELFNKKNIKVEIKGEGHVKSNKELIEQAVRNLIGNAAKYARPDTTLYIDIDSKGFTMSNLTDQKIRNVNDLKKPFVKGEESRGTENGAGLGLSIAENCLISAGYNLVIEFEDETFRAIVRW